MDPEFHFEPQTFVGALTKLDFADVIVARPRICPPYFPPQFITSMAAMGLLREQPR